MHSITNLLDDEIWDGQLRGAMTNGSEWTNVLITTDQWIHLTFGPEHDFKAQSLEGRRRKRSTEYST